MGVVVLSVEIKLEDNQYVARCVELGTSTCADTTSEAIDNISEAIELHLEALEEVGELSLVLREAGVEITQPSELALATQERAPLSNNWVRKMESSVRVPVYAQDPAQ